MISNRRHTLLGIAISLRAAITSLVIHDIQSCVLKFLVKMTRANSQNHAAGNVGSVGRSVVKLLRERDLPVRALVHRLVDIALKR
jgi:hypothetical protein